MARGGERTSEPVSMPAVPETAAATVVELTATLEPAAYSDPINPPTHPSSRKPDTPNAGGGGHGK